MRYVFWNPVRDAELKRRWAAGETSGEIGKALGCDSALVRTRVRRMKLPARGVANRSYPVEHDAEIIRLWGEMVSPIEIGKHLGRTPKSIADAAWRLGLPRRFRVPGQKGEGPKPRPALRVAASNPDPKPAAYRSAWAGVPVRAVRITPRKLHYIQRFLDARWRMDTVARLFDVSPDAIVEALKCAS